MFVVEFIFKVSKHVIGKCLLIYFKLIHDELFLLDSVVIGAFLVIRNAMIC